MTAPMVGRSGEPATARIDPVAVRAYDIRGVAGRQVGAEGVRSLGLGYATLARQRGLSRIGVGRDGRLSSPELEGALVAGLVAGGMRVERIGLGPTPKLGFAVRTLGLDGGVMVTASHNPPDENGLKLLLGAERLHGEPLKALAALVGTPATGGDAREVRVCDAYEDALCAAAEGVRPLRVAWDCGNGATGPTVARITRRLPGEHILMNTEVDGRFPNHHPDPAVEANLADLAATVREQGCDLGVAFDGDGDRIGVVDETGCPIASDHLLLFLAEDLLARRPGAVVVGDVKSSARLFEGVAALGGRAVTAPSGYVLVREAMRREQALLAGELSGHIFFAEEWDGVDDALYAAVRVLQALSRRDTPLSAFRKRLPPTFATPELRILCAHPQAVVARASARRTGGDPFDAAMGLRVTSADGWWLLRASGTERKITCRCESDTPEGLARLKRALAAELRACGVGEAAALLSPP
jgi:phosphomannomutase